jgi:hypothetical protein
MSPRGSPNRSYLGPRLSRPFTTNITQGGLDLLSWPAPWIALRFARPWYRWKDPRPRPLQDLWRLLLVLVAGRAALRTRAKSGPPLRGA